MVFPDSPDCQDLMESRDNLVFQASLQPMTLFDLSIIHK
jgi:hypothetical protein